MLEQIEKYFDNKLSLAERQVFENQMLTNDAFAKEVAFYVQARAASKDLANDKRRQEFEALRTQLHRPKSQNIKPIIWLSGLAASLIIGFGLWSFIGSNTKSSETLADVYIQQHFENLPIKMDGKTDSLQLGLRLFNEQKLKDAQLIFEDIYKKENTNSEAIKFSGITALRLKEYDKAVDFFNLLSHQKGLYTNPGLFYEAIALLKQTPLFKDRTIALLKEVVAKDMEGKNEAIEILEELE